MSARQSWPMRITLAVSAVLLATWSSLLVPGYALGAPAANGNNGTVKLGSAGVPFTNANDPHLTCPIQIQWSGFDPGTQTFSVAFNSAAPTGGSVVGVQSNNPPDTTFSAQPWVETYSLTFGGGANPNNKGEYHVSITVNTTSSTGTTDVKNKTVWVGGCAANPTGGSVTMSGACTTNTVGSDYTWTVTAAPATAGGGSDVSGTWANHVNAASPSGTWSTTNGTGSFTTPAGVNQIDVALDAAFSGANWTISQPAAAPQSCGHAPSGGTVSVSGACTSNAAGSGYTWSVSESPKAGASTAAVNGSWQQTGGPGSGSFSTNAAGSGSFTTASGANAITVALDAASTAAGWSIAQQPGAAPASCGTPGNPGTPETPASVAFSSTCTGIHAVFTTASQHTTVFTVTAPHNVTDTVSGSGTRDYNADKNDGHLSVSFDGTSQTYDWVDPGNCSTPPPPGQAQPDATATNACVTGITVVLSNMNGTAPATFTVTAPDGTTTTVPVNAGQLKKLDFAVAEDTTGVVTVSAPGFAKTFTYAKNCTKVLGEKHTVKPPKTPTKVLGEKKELPFTGFDAKSALFDAASLVALGAIVCALALPRRRRFGPYPQG